MTVTDLRAGPADAPYFQALSEGRLIMQCCQGCGKWQWPAVSRCGDCGMSDPEWRDLPFEGVVFSWTKVHYPFAGTEGIGVPFVTVLAALPQAGNRRLLGLFEGDEATLDFDLRLKGRAAETKFGNRMIPSIRWRLA